MSDNKVRYLSGSGLRGAGTAASGSHVSDALATSWSVSAGIALCVSAGFVDSGQGLANLLHKFDRDVNLIAVAAGVTIPFLIAPFGVKSAHSLNAAAAKSAIAALPIATAAIVMYNILTG